MTKRLVALLLSSYLLAGCILSEDKAAKVQEYVATGCQFAIDHEVVVKMLASADATATTVAALGTMICRSYVASHSGVSTLVAPKCPYGEVFGVCIEGKPVDKVD